MGVKRAKKNPPSFSKVIGELDAHVFGQARAKTALVKACLSQTPENIFLIGPTGSGKTHIVTTLSGIINQPVVHFDCTTLTPRGYKGQSVDTLLEAIAVALAVSSTPIVFLDEFDKLGCGGGPENSDLGNQVQRQLLRIIEGGSFSFEGGDGFRKETVLVDTSGCTFIMAGSFEHVDLYSPSRPAVGIARDEASGASIGTAHRLKHLIDALGRAGIIREVLGRVTEYVVLQKIDGTFRKEVYTAISNRVLEITTKHNYVQIRQCERMIDAMVDEVLELDLGMRGIRLVTNRLETVLISSILENSEAEIHLVSRNGVILAVIDGAGNA